VIEFPKRCVFSYFKSGGWTKSENPVSLCSIVVIIITAATTPILILSDESHAYYKYPISSIDISDF
jgi:hypothetical protein